VVYDKAREVKPLVAVLNSLSRFYPLGSIISALQARSSLGFTIIITPLHHTARDFNPIIRGAASNKRTK